MKNTKIIKQTVCEPTIDWDKPQWLINKDSPSLIVLSTGKHAGHQFEGIALPCESYPYGENTNDWYKSVFIPINSPLVIEISN